MSLWESWIRPSLKWKRRSRDKKADKRIGGLGEKVLGSFRDHAREKEVLRPTSVGAVREPPLHRPRKVNISFLLPRSAGLVFMRR